MRRAALVALALVAFPARGQQLYGPDSPTPIQRPYPSPQVWAPFNVAQCLPTGGIGDVTQGATITTTRASTQTVAVPNTNQTTPGLIPEDAGTVSHVVWNGSALVDTKGNAWTQNGTVPQVPASWYAPPAAGPYSAANNYSLAAGAPSAAWDFRGTDFSITAVVSTPNTSVLQIIMSKQNAGQTTGWILYMANTGRAIFLTGGDGSVASTATLSPGKPSVVTVGRSGGNWYMRVDGSAAVSSVAGTAASASGDPLGMGLWAGPNTYPWLGQIYETLTTTTPYNDAAVGALQASVLAKIGKGTLSTCPAASLAVGVQGAEVYAAGTNYALQSSTSCVGNAVQAPWTLANATCLSDVAVAPDGTTTMDEWTSTTSGGAFLQAVTVPSTTSVVASIWASKASGTGTVSTALGGAPSPPTYCACGTTDGSACHARVGGNYCYAYITAVTPVPVRSWTAATWGAAFTSATAYFYPGEVIVSAGTARFWGAQVEPGLYPTPYVPTTTATANRAATVSTVPLPDLTGNCWAIGVTATPAVNWATAPGGPGVAMLWGTGGAAPGVGSTSLYRTVTSLILTVYDTASTNRVVNVAHGLGTSTTPHRVVALNARGLLSLYLDGALIGTTSTGSGPGTPVSYQTPIGIGSMASGEYPFIGSVRDFRVYPTTCTYRAGM